MYRGPTLDVIAHLRLVVRRLQYKSILIRCAEMAAPLRLEQFNYERCPNAKTVSRNPVMNVSVSTTPIKLKSSRNKAGLSLIWRCIEFETQHSRVPPPGRRQSSKQRTLALSQYKNPQDEGYLSSHFAHGDLNWNIAALVYISRSRHRSPEAAKRQVAIVNTM